MKKLSTLLMCGAMALSASALTIDDLTGVYEMNDTYGYDYYITAANAYTYYGGYATYMSQPDATDQFLKKIVVTAEGNQLHFSNFMCFDFYADVDLDAGTVTIPVQEITATTGYVYTMCDYVYGLSTTEDAKPLVMTIDANGDFRTPITGEGDDAVYSYIGFYSYYNDVLNVYGWLSGNFHKTADLTFDEDTKAILGTYACDKFSGQWTWLWGQNGDETAWYPFNTETGEGIADIYFATQGGYNIEIEAIYDNEVKVCGLWWGQQDITGSYDATEKIITFPLQSVWDGYTFCNSSFWDAEVPTTDDIVPATAKVNEDGSITFNYTAAYASSAGVSGYLYGIDQTVTPGATGIQNIATENVDGEAEYFNLQGMRVRPEVGGLYIVRQGDKVTKQIIR